MAVATYTPSATRIIHWTGVDFNSRPSSFAPIHLVQYDQRIPIIAVRLYNSGQTYTLPSNVTANILVEKVDGTFVSNPALGCNAERNVLYFEATYQMVYFSGTIMPVVELKISDTETGSSSAITVIVDRNPVQENAKESTNEYKSAEQFMNTALDAKNQAVASANSANQSKIAAAQSAANAAESEQNARDYAMAGVELMASLKSSHSVQERLLDSSGNPITDGSGNEVMGAIQFTTNDELLNMKNQVSVLSDRSGVLNDQNNQQTLQIRSLEEKANRLEERARKLEQLVEELTNYAMAGVELMASLKSSHSVQERLLDSSGNPITDGSGNEVMGAIQFTTNDELLNMKNQVSVLSDRSGVLNDQNNQQTLQIRSLEEKANRLEEHAILDSGY